MFAKIIHIADVYDAITSERPYKKAQSPKEAIEFLMNNAGKMFQPEYVKAFITYIPVYPKGRNVILSDGNVAVVVENRQYHTLYPVVRRLSVVKRLIWQNKMRILVSHFRFWILRGNKKDPGSKRDICVSKYSFEPGFFFYLRMEKGGYLKRELTMCEI